MKITKDQANKKAIRLVKKHLHNQNPSDWKFNILTADQILQNKFKVDEAYFKYSVIVECLKMNSTLECPLILIVDLAKEEVRQI